MSSIPKLTIGWREWVRLPALQVNSVKAKIDTGARTSALHAFDLEYFRRRGIEMVRFNVHPKQRSIRGEVQAEAALLEMREVRDSGGKVSLRPVIQTILEVGDISWVIELTLVNRDQMGFRMLLGRQAVRGHLVVDPGRSYLIGNKPTVRKKKKKA